LGGGVGGGGGGGGGYLDPCPPPPHIPVGKGASAKNGACALYACTIYTIYFHPLALALALALALSKVRYGVNFMR